MSIRTVASTLAVLAMVGAAPVVAAAAQGPAQGQAQTPPLPPKPDPKPEPKPEAKPEAKPATAAILAGKWDVNIESPNGAMQSALELKADAKDAKKVAGSISSPVGEAVLEGEVVDGKLTFWFKLNANGTDLSVTFTGTLQKDGSLAGTLEYGQGEVPWTATREKK